jgi:hypothetical protein
MCFHHYITSERSERSDSQSSSSIALKNDTEGFQDRRINYLSDSRRTNFPVCILWSLPTLRKIKNNIMNGLLIIEYIFFWRLLEICHMRTASRYIALGTLLLITTSIYQFILTTCTVQNTLVVDVLCNHSIRETSVNKHYSDQLQNPHVKVAWIQKFPWQDFPNVVFPAQCKNLTCTLHFQDLGTYKPDQNQ